MSNIIDRLISQVEDRYLEYEIENKTIKEMDLISLQSGEYLYFVFEDKTFTLIYAEGKHHLDIVLKSDIKEIMQDEFMLESALKWIK